jgi:hypothetical protein
MNLCQEDEKEITNKYLNSLVYIDKEICYFVLTFTVFLMGIRRNNRDLYRYKKYIMKNFTNREVIRFTLSCKKPLSYSDFLLISEFGSPKIINETIKQLISNSHYNLFGDYDYEYNKYLKNGVKLLLLCNTTPIEITNSYRIRDKEIKNIINENRELYPEKVNLKFLIYDIGHFISTPIRYLVEFLLNK